MINLTGIPGTISPEAARIRWCRVEGNFVKDEARAYRAIVPDWILGAIASRDEVESGKRLWHLSVSHHNHHDWPDRCPTWDELKHAAYRLVQADVPLVLIFPRRSTSKEKYVDIHPTTLHLWESTEPVDL